MGGKIKFLFLVFHVFLHFGKASYSPTVLVVSIYIVTLGLDLRVRGRSENMNL